MRNRVQQDPPLTYSVGACRAVAVHRHPPWTPCPKPKPLQDLTRNVHYLRHHYVFLHLQLLLATFVHRYDLVLETPAVHFSHHFGAKNGLAIRVSRSVFFSHGQFFLCSNLLSSRCFTSAMGVFQFQPLRISFPLKFTNATVKSGYFTFLLHEFRSRSSKHVISMTIKKRVRSVYRIRESKERFVAPKNLLMTSQGKIFSIGKRFMIQPTRKVSMNLSDLEMNWTSSFLVQSDKLVIVLHLLLAPLYTVVKPAEREFAHRRSPSLEVVSRCSQQNRRSTLYSVSGRTVGEVKAFRVSSLSSAAEQRRFAMTFVWWSSRDSLRWKRKTVKYMRKRKK